MKRSACLSMAVGFAISVSLCGAAWVHGSAEQGGPPQIGPPQAGPPKLSPTEKMQRAIAALKQKGVALVAHPQLDPKVFLHVNHALSPGRADLFLERGVTQVDFHGDKAAFKKLDDGPEMSVSYHAPEKGNYVVDVAVGVLVPHPSNPVPEFHSFVRNIDGSRTPGPTLQVSDGHYFFVFTTKSFNSVHFSVWCTNVDWVFHSVEITQVK